MVASVCPWIWYTVFCSSFLKSARRDRVEEVYHWTRKPPCSVLGSIPEYSQPFFMSFMCHNQLFFTFGLFGFASRNQCFILRHAVSLVFSNYPFPYLLQTEIIVHNFFYIYYSHLLFLFCLHSSFLRTKKIHFMA